jgi:hypothetical protein
MHAVLDPEQPFYLSFDKPRAPGQLEAEQEAKSAAVAGDRKVDDVATLPLTHSLSIDSVDLDDETAAALGTSFAEQLRPGDSADFRGVATQNVWVTVRVSQISPTDTELCLESSLLPEAIWVSVEDDMNRWAVAGSKATGSAPGAPGGSGVGPSSEARRALDEAEIRKMLQSSSSSALQERISWHPGRLCDMRHSVDGLWYQVSRGAIFLLFFYLLCVTRRIVRCTVYSFAMDSCV